MTKRFYRLLTELSSHKWVSQLTGKFAKSRMSRSFISRFAKIYNIPVEEAEKPIHEYQSLNDFFTRRLKPHMRPIDPSPFAAVSPVDARVSGIGYIQSGGTLRVKGQDYSLEELLNRSPRTMNYTHGFFIVLYLSPRDYHRIHAPVSGTIIEKEHVPGKAYPVNDFGLWHIKRVLSRNERLITYIEHEFGEIAVVKVGALNVSSIRYVPDLPDRLERGEEMAYFEFGSTVVLLMENGTFEPRHDLGPGSRVLVGQAIGRFIAKKN